MDDYLEHKFDMLHETIEQLKKDVSYWKNCSEALGDKLREKTFEVDRWKQEAEAAQKLISEHIRPELRGEYDKIRRMK